MTSPLDDRVDVVCPQCGRSVAIDRRELGASVTCDNCLEEFVPVSQQAEAAARPAKRATEREQLGVNAPNEPPDDDQWLPVDEDLWEEEAVAGSQSRAKSLDRDYEFTILCPLCSTRQDVTDDQVGTAIRCPDCHSRFPVRLPPVRRRRARTERRGPEVDELRLGPPAVGPEDVSPVPMLPARGGAKIKVVSSPGEDALRKAEAEWKQKQQSRVPPPANPLVRIFGFFAEPQVLARWLGLAAGLQVEASVITAVVTTFHASNPLVQFIAMLLTIFSILFGILLFSAISMTGLTMLRETANGGDRVEDWPHWDVVEWTIESLVVASCGLVTAIVSGLAGQLFSMFGAPVYVVGLTLCVVTGVAVLLPFLILSCLENGSTFQFFSEPVWQSVLEGTSRWIRFAVFSWTLGLLAVLVWQLRGLESALLNFVAAAAVIAAVLLYFRELGRLAWTSQQKSAWSVSQGAPRPDGPNASDPPADRRGAS